MTLKNKLVIYDLLSLPYRVCNILLPVIQWRAVKPARLRVTVDYVTLSDVLGVAVIILAVAVVVVGRVVAVAIDVVALMRGAVVVLISVAAVAAVVGSLHSVVVIVRVGVVVGAASGRS